MTRQRGSVAEQDALSNAFLALFGILVLIIIQIGFEDIDARAQAHSYAQPPGSIDALDGGWTPVAWAPRPSLVVVRTATERVRVVSVPASGIPVSGASQLLIVESSRDSSASEPSYLHRIRVKSQAVAPGGIPARKPGLVRIENQGSSPAIVGLWLDDGRVGTASDPLRIGAGSFAAVRLCADGPALVFLDSVGACW